MKINPVKKLLQKLFTTNLICLYFLLATPAFAWNPPTKSGFPEIEVIGTVPDVLARLKNGLLGNGMIFIKESSNSVEFSGRIERQTFGQALTSALATSDMLRNGQVQYDQIYNVVERNGKTILICIFTQTLDPGSPGARKTYLSDNEKQFAEIQASLESLKESLQSK